MLNYYRKAGTTSVSVVIRIVDSTDGSPETGVVYNTAGIDIRYRRDYAADTAITEVTLASLATAYTSGGFLHIGDGYYRVDIPDAAVAAGAAGVLIHGTVTGMIVMGCYVHLNLQDASDMSAAVVDQALSGHTTAGTVGASLNNSEQALTAPRAEPGVGAPAVNATLPQKVDFLFAAWRNRVLQTGSQYTVYADNGTTVLFKAALTNAAGTSERAELVSGP